MVESYIKPSDCKIVDLFCGIGGLSYGLKKEKFKITAGYDVDEKCKFIFESNNKSKFYTQDVATLKGVELEKHFANAKVKILVGCAPCQPFSSYTFKEKNKDNNKWGLLYHFSRIIKETQPDIVSMENVAQLLNFKQAPVFNDFVDELKDEGYYVHYEIVNCPDYGMPQKRKRLVLLASKFGHIDLVEKTHNPKNYVTVHDAIGSLPPINDGESHPNDPMHYARELDAINKLRIRNTPYGGGWKDWPEELVLECHKKQSGKTYSSVYGRMKWEEPSPTITTHCIGLGNGRFGHPEQNRAISLREAAILQTFPANYKFFPDGHKPPIVALSRQLGNAVPVRLGEIIGQSIKKHLKKITINHGKPTST